MKRILAILLAASALFVSCIKDQAPSISIDGQTSYELGPAQIMLSISLNATSSDWQYDLGGAAWLTESKKEDRRLTLRVSANDGVDARSAVITFYYASPSESGAATVSVRQEAKVAEPEITFEAPGEIPAEGGSVSVAISGNQGGWEAEPTADYDWLTYSVANGVLTATAGLNPTEFVRSARIRIYAPSKATALVFKDLVINQKANIIEYQTEDLSASGTSNCYVITHRGPYTFNATVKGNGEGASGLATPEAMSPAGVKLVWQTVKGMISDLSISDGVVSFEASKATGSAVIAVTDASGTIIWSWHIWHPAIEIAELRHAGPGSRMMNLNLGALDNAPGSISSFGMHYQWGRKDPFPYSPVSHDGSVYTMPIPVYDAEGKAVEIGQTDRYSLTDNTIAFSIANPSVCISNNAQASDVTRDWLIPSQSNLALWGNPKGAERTDGKYRYEGAKSYMDPCPPGWRVPPAGEFVNFTESGGYTWATGDTVEGLVFSDLGGEAAVAVADIDEDGKYTIRDWQDGWWLWLDRDHGVKSFFPASARYDGGYAMLMGSMSGLWANYWTNAASDDTAPGTAIALSFSLTDYNKNYQITISPVSNGARADGYSVRCIKE